MKQAPILMTDAERTLFLEELATAQFDWAEDDPRRSTLSAMVKKWSYNDYFAVPEEDDPETGEMIAALMVGGVLLYVGNGHPFVTGVTTTVPRPFPFVVMANDIFAWGCADAEDLTRDDLPDLYAKWYADPLWGSVRWLCFKRNEQPQRPVIDLMREAGSWDDTLDALPENGYDKAWRLHHESKQKEKNDAAN